jgi:hypothetical protein
VKSFSLSKIKNKFILLTIFDIVYGLLFYCVINVKIKFIFLTLYHIVYGLLLVSAEGYRGTIAIDNLLNSY